MCYSSSRSRCSFGQCLSKQRQCATRRRGSFQRPQYCRPSLTSFALLRAGRSFQRPQYCRPSLTSFALLRAGRSFQRPQYCRPSDLDAQDLSVALGVDAGGDQGVHSDDAACLAHLEHQGVGGEEGIRAGIERAGPKRLLPAAIHSLGLMLPGNLELGSAYLTGRHSLAWPHAARQPGTGVRLPYRPPFTRLASWE